MPSPGTFAEHLCVAKQLIFPKPTHLNYTEAAALPLAGLTAWRALFTQGRCTPSDRVLVTGVGGGVARPLHQLEQALVHHAPGRSGQVACRVLGLTQGVEHGSTGLGVDDV